MDGSSVMNGPRRRVQVIAEVAGAHQGDPRKAEELARLALKAGADTVKFQVYSAGELLVRSHPKFDHFARQSFPAETWKEIFSRLAGEGEKIYADVFGLPSLEWIGACGLAGYKIHSSDLTNVPLLRAVFATDKPILLSTGGSTAREIRLALRLAGSSPRRRPVLLHGYQGYPTPLEETRLHRLAWLKENFGDRCDIGYMDHSDADDAYALVLPNLAVALGATVIEKHITLNRAERGIDHFSSLNPDEFARFVEYVRKSESTLYGPCEEFAPSERTYRKQVKKHWVAAQSLEAGHLMEEKDLLMKRVPDLDRAPLEMDKIIGKKLVRHLPADTAVSRSDLSLCAWALVVARMRSTRLPGKALLNVAGRPALAHLFERLKQVNGLDRIVLCTTREREDDPLVELARMAGIPHHRGETEDVLARMLGALGGSVVDLVLRVTGDDILVDPDYAAAAIAHHLSVHAEYTDLKKLPSGTEIEVFDVDLLQDFKALARDTGGTEYLTTYVTDHRDQIRTSSAAVEERHARNWRLTLDTPEDYEVIKRLLEAMKAGGKELTYRMDDIVAFFQVNPEILNLNAKTSQRTLPGGFTTALNWRLAHGTQNP